MNASPPKPLGLLIGAICSLALASLSPNHALASQTTAKAIAFGLDDTTPRQDEEIRAGMRKYLGVPYKKAGASKKGFDCSGLVKVIYNEMFGVDLPHQSSQQSRSPELVHIPLDSLRTGDLVFFSISGNKKAINHVGIYLSEGEFIHAGRSTGVVVAELGAPYWRSRIVGARRLAARNPFHPEKNLLDLAFFFDRENALFFRYDKNASAPVQTSLFEKHPLHSFEGEEVHRVEFEFATQAHPSLIPRLTVFRESLLFPENGNHLAHHSILGSQDTYENGGAFAQGVSLAGSLRPSANFSFTPSLSYFEYGPSLNETALPRLLAGLRFNLFSSSNGWSFSTDVRMPLSRYPSALVSGQADESLPDVAFTYRQRLSNRIHLSLSGEKHFGFMPALREAHSRPDTDDQKLTLMFHFSY